MKLPKSDMAWSNRERIVVRGHDLATELMGTVSFGDMAFLEITGRLPDAGESLVFNAMLVALVEHGMTPSALVARLTLLGAPDALQAAVAAGLCGLGPTFVGSIENAARLLQRTDLPKDAQEAAALIVQEHRRERRHLPGLGHPTHTEGDPRTVRLFALGRQTGVAGSGVELMEAIARAAEEAFDRRLPINATGAIAALATDMGLSWRVTRGLGVMARAVGLVGHLLEEMNTPMARALWDEAETATSPA